MRGGQASCRLFSGFSSVEEKTLGFSTNTDDGAFVVVANEDGINKASVTSVESSSHHEASCKITFGGNQAEMPNQHLVCDDIHYGYVLK